MEELPFNPQEPPIHRRMTAVVAEVLGDNTPPELLYHYTTLESLRGIVQSRTMWASDLGFLSDPEEIRFGTTVIRGRVNERLQRSADEPERKACLSFLEAVGWERASLGGPWSRSFAFSLSEADDLLSQWRGYAPNQDGVAIGFSTGGLAAQAARQWFKFVRCRYETAEQVALVDALIAKVVAEARAASDTAAYLTDGNGEPGAWNHWIVPGVMVLAATFKRASFAQEHEWRVVAAAESLSGPYTRFRVRDRELVPYLEFGLGGADHPLPIDRVRIGPGPNQDLRMLAVRGIVHQATWGLTKDHTTVEVVPSSITLR